jgi:hypothetical protein
VKEILLVHFIITNFRVAHKMLCTPWLRNPLTTSRLSCLGRKAALTTIFLSVRQSRISQPCYCRAVQDQCKQTENHIWYRFSSKKVVPNGVMRMCRLDLKHTIYSAFTFVLDQSRLWKFGELYGKTVAE